MCEASKIFKVKFKPFKTFSTKEGLQTNKFSGGIIVSTGSTYLYFVNIIKQLLEILKSNTKLESVCWIKKYQNEWSTNR